MSELQKTIIIRSDSGMIRDCWWEKDLIFPDQKVFILRQVQGFETGQPRCKEFRLTEPEYMLVFNILKNKMEGK